MRLTDADLISRKAAVSRISDLIVLELRNERIPTWNEVYKALNDLPTLDAVPVVRCKDCKHGQPMIYTRTERPCIMCSHLGSGFFARVFNPNWYCADGERREEDAAD